LTSPTPECGKTTALNLIGALVPKPLPSSNITAAAVFRGIEKWRPTLLIDEADTFIKNNDDLRGVINSGHSRRSAFVIRVTGDNLEPTRFTTWAPKAIALIGRLPGTLEDRSIQVRMERKGTGDKVERLRLDALDEFEPLGRRAWTWAQENLDRLRGADPDVPDGLNDREADNWRPLLAIADLAGGSWPERAREAARRLSGVVEDAPEESLQVLADVREAFREVGEEKLPTSVLLEELNELEESPWAESNRGRGLNANQLAAFLRPFGVKSAPLWVGTGPGGKMLRGYRWKDLKRPFERYLPNRSAGEGLQDPQEPRRSATEAVDGGRKDQLSLAPLSEAGEPRPTGPLATLAADDPPPSEGEDS